MSRPISYLVLLAGALTAKALNNPNPASNDNVFVRDAYLVQESATRLFSNPVETTTSVVDSLSSTAHLGIIVTRTDQDGNTITTTFKPLSSTITSITSLSSTTIHGYTNTESFTTTSEEPPSITTSPSGSSSSSTSNSDKNTAESNIPASLSETSNPAATPSPLAGRAVVGVAAALGLAMAV
ncbi:hypothetical protein G7046_g6260 [Stylonectria norvegica]|nr:hypothetical protein G7046_g6260 [Stylonectria norvegica]